MQPDETDELARLSFFDGPKPPATFVDQSHGSLGKLVALLPGPPRRVVLHDIRVGIHRREWFKVRWSPLSEPKPRSEEFSRMAHVGQMHKDTGIQRRRRPSAAIPG